MDTDEKYLLYPHFMHLDKASISIPQLFKAKCIFNSSEITF